ncbi:MAG: hypothetical protein R3B47_07350 [Bacteroidia bacterium]
MHNIQLTISLEEANLILESLGNMPFVKVHQLVNKIQQQAQAQLTPPEISGNGTDSYTPS